MNTHHTSGGRTSLRAAFKILTASALAALIFSGCSREARTARHMGRAEHYLASGEFEKAKIEYLTALRFNSRNATALRQLGVIWLRQGAPLRAMPFLQEAIGIAPEDTLARKKLALAYFWTGHPAEEGKEALEIFRQSPADGDAILLLAESARSDADRAELEKRLHNFPEPRPATWQIANAMLALEKNDTVSAENALRRAFESDPKSSRAHLLMAEVCRVKKDPAGVERELKAASELSEPASMECLAYAEYKARTGDANAARALLKDLARRTPDYLPATELLARIAIGEKKYDEADALIENLLSRDAFNFSARMLQGQVGLLRGDAKKAVEVLDNLDKLYTNVPQVKYQLARARLLANQPNEAAGALRQAIELTPDYPEAVILLGELNLKSGDARPVVAAMEGLLKKHPGIDHARTLLAAAYRMLGRLDDAAEIFRAQSKGAPDNPAPFLILGSIHLEQRKYGEAREELEKALALAPAEFSIAAKIVELDLAEKKYDAALELAEDRIKRSPGSAAAQFLKANIYAARGDKNLLEPALLKTLELDPSCAGAYDLLLASDVSNNGLKKAGELLESVLAKNSDDSRWLMFSALINDKLGECEKTRNAYEKLLSKEPDQVAVLNNLAWLYATKLNQLDRARELARSARARKPGDAWIADTLGWVFYLQGDYQQALSLSRESAGKLPELPEAQFHFGMASYMMDREDDARAALGRAVASGSVFPGLEEAKRRLGLLGDGTGNSAAKSISDLESWLKKSPDDVVARLRLAVACEQQGDFSKAAAAAGEAFKTNPKLASAALQLARLYAGPLHRLDRALEFAKAARDLAPDDPGTAAILGSIAFRTGSYAWAYSLLREPAAGPGRDPRLLSDFAWAAYSLGKVGEAQDAMRRIPADCPDKELAGSAANFLSMTALCENSAATAGSEAAIRKVLSEDPAYAPALMALAGLQSDRGQKKEAIDSYTAVLRVFPDFSPAQKRLAILWMDDPATLEKARELAVKARQSMPDDIELTQALAEISYRRNDFSYAARLLEERARHTPASARCLYYLGMSRLQLKENSLSRDALKQALAAGLDEPLATNAKRSLVALEKN